MYRIGSSAVLKKNKNPTKSRAANSHSFSQNRQKTANVSRAARGDVRE
jgi:hypothetical protein